ncbi:MAG TPA: efflux RND transporter periplasmic adaptor subunit [Usitatibacteraceae bacterium]|nr:efflux RND transporter periplasmic adaptor subunit [Usitatibacteraceae bacterium]HQY48226.1 efflux RND transporter periplasmic adaptor subunit [Usitatibacteraceae bacterium]
MKLTKRTLGYAIFTIGVVALLAWWAWPSPRLVETARAGRGPVQVAIEEDGETRAVDRYGVAAPVAGRLLRVVLREGDAVKAGQAVAEIAPLPLSEADRDLLEAKLEAAKALKLEADERVRRAEADAAQAERERVRVADLVAKKFMSDQALEQADVSAKTKAADVKAAKSRAVAAAAEVEAARATLVAVRAKAPTVRVSSPVDGRVLRITEKSERVVQPGTVLVTVGDPAALEIVIDVLSNDAVRVKPGMRMLVTGWGGPEVEAAVRLVEPAAFRKISALGVEEQRVNVIADFKSVPPGIGDAYRVDARIVVAEKPDALLLPVGALFRRDGKWTVFVVDGGRLAARTVEIGLRGARNAEVIAGLSEGEVVVLYPGNELAEGVRVRPRQ